MRRTGPPSLGGSGWSTEANCACAARQAVRAGGGRVLDVVQVEEGHHGEDHEDRGGSDGPADLERRVAADLVRSAAAAGAVLHERPDQRAPDEQEDHDPDVERDLVERVDVIRVLRPARLGRERVRESSRRRDQDRDCGRRKGGEEQASGHAGGQGRGIISPLPDKGSTSCHLPRAGSVRRAERRLAGGPAGLHLELAHPQATHVELLDAELLDHRAPDREPADRDRAEGRSTDGECAEGAGARRRARRWPGRRLPWRPPRWPRAPR